MRLFIDGTQRGLLQFLFGAGALILLHKTMKSDGPVAVAALYVRRNFWLAIAGLFDGFVSSGSVTSSFRTALRRCCSFLSVA